MLRPFRPLAFLLAAALLLSASCRKPPPLQRIGILCTLDYFLDTAEGFQSGMSELGYREGGNILYDLRRSQADSAATERILRDFVAGGVDLIFVFATDGAVAAKQLTADSGIPVLFANANIEGQNLVHSVTAPGGNITGVRYPGPDLTLKRFEIMHELAPAARRMWVPYRRGRTVVVSQLEALRPAAREAGVTLLESPADGLEELQGLLEGWERTGRVPFEAILMIAEPLLVTPDVFAAVARFAHPRRIPVGGAMISAAGYTSLFGVSTDNRAVGRQAAKLAAKILRGAPAGEIPVSSAESFLQFSLGAAKALGMQLPAGLLKQADQVLP
jgi:putative ABC transport system substrate-binding protein